jgi:branched-chain amino acid transport system ATP-binding protein
MSEPLLVAAGLVGGYGGMDILRGVDLTLGADEIGVVVGPNGAGKSTALKALFGLVHVRQGSVRFDREDITNSPPESLVRRGLAYVPQEGNVFSTLTVEENLEMGAYTRRGGVRAALERTYALFPDLLPKRRQPAGELSGGQRQMVAIGRALMVEPKLLMLDEPSAGLSPKVLELILARILAIHQSGVGVLMVEQNARAALRIASRGFVLAGGRNRFTGPGPELLANREVAASFLGG